ncbi:ATP-binding protein [Halomonas binhaiensis]|uniref:histidine kinase n=1 Tax=Halomonas binhaiensis TaxID=2562282 RepID=A0A856QVL8_9GAMM|nr:ATP-binding protein [Halomonas binhaiensis]QEM84140.2 HAMP domain-containing protein [Halomonas binhaiensis]
MFAKRLPAFSRLGIKLFAIILVVNVAIAGAVFVAISRSLDQGFLDYLSRSQTQRAETLAASLGEAWSGRQSWQWLRESPRAWHELVRRQLWPGSKPRPMSLEGNLSNPRNFVLHDENGLPVIGLPPEDDEGAAELRWIPVMSHDRQVGTLGYRPPDQLMERMDRLFLKQQRRNLTIIIIALALTSLLLAGALSWWVGRRTRSMATATRRLTEGDYSVRLPERGRDELSNLSHDFNVLAETLETSREARSRWVSDIAHELRTPLAVLRGEIEAMLDGIRSLSQDNLHSLAQEVGQLERLVGDLRLLSQSDAGALEVQLAPLDLAEHLDSRLEEAGGWLDDHGLTLERHVDGPAWIRGDLQRLRQLWNNLLDNTSAYTQSPGQLKVSLERENDVWVLRWEDSAPGVPESELPRLTERLYRVEGSRNRASGGSGLGLSIATALARAHDAEMTPSISALGGLCWTLRFPALSSHLQLEEDE